MGADDRRVGVAVERLDPEESEAGGEAAVGGVVEPGEWRGAAGGAGGERHSSRDEELGRRTVECDVGPVGGAHAHSERHTPVGERTDAALDAEREALEPEVDAGRRGDHVAEGERGADVAQVEEAVAVDARFGGPAVVAQCEHRDVACVEPEQRRELGGDGVLQIAARCETCECGGEVVEEVVDRQAGRFDPVGAGAQRVGDGGREPGRGGVAHPVLDRLEEVGEQLEEERRVQGRGGEPGTQIGRHPGADRIAPRDQFHAEFTEVHLTADVGRQGQLRAGEPAEIAFCSVDGVTSDPRHRALDDRTARPAVEDLARVGHIDAGVCERHVCAVADDHAAVGQLQLQRESCAEVVAPAELERVALGPLQRTLDVVVVDAGADDARLAVGRPRDDHADRHERRRERAGGVQGAVGAVVAGGPGSSACGGADECRHRTDARLDREVVAALGLQPGLEAGRAVEHRCRTVERDAHVELAQRRVVDVDRARHLEAHQITEAGAGQVEVQVGRRARSGRHAGAVGIGVALRADAVPDVDPQGRVDRRILQHELQHAVGQTERVVDQCLELLQRLGNPRRERRLAVARGVAPFDLQRVLGPERHEPVPVGVEVAVDDEFLERSTGVGRRRQAVTVTVGDEGARFAAGRRDTPLDARRILRQRLGGALQRHVGRRGDARVERDRPDVGVWRALDHALDVRVLNAAELVDHPAQLVDLSDDVGRADADQVDRGVERVASDRVLQVGHERIQHGEDVGELRQRVALDVVALAVGERDWVQHVTVGVRTVQLRRRQDCGDVADFAVIVDQLRSHEAGFGEQVDRCGRR